MKDAEHNPWVRAATITAIGTVSTITMALATLGAYALALHFGWLA